MHQTKPASHLELEMESHSLLVLVPVLELLLVLDSLPVPLS
jgi:hypothetical protein